MSKYALSYGSYCKIHGMEMMIQQAEEEGRLEALFDQAYGKYARHVERMSDNPDTIKRKLMQADASDFSEVFRLLEQLKTDGVIELDHGEEIRIGQIPEQCTDDTKRYCGTDCSQSNLGSEAQPHPADAEP